MGAGAVGEVDEGVDGRGSKGETCGKETDNLEGKVSTRISDMGMRGRTATW